MSKVWTVVVVLALLSFTAVVFGAQDQEDGWAGDPDAGSGGISGDYKTNWVWTGAEESWEGWWDNDDGEWVPAGEGGDVGLTVEAYIELYASQTQQTKAVFHWGQPPFAAQSAILEGTVIQNHPCWVGIRKDGWAESDNTKAASLGFVEDGFGGKAAKSDAGEYAPLGDTIADIPLTWEMAIAGGSYHAMTWTGGTNAENWGWYSDGRVPVGTVDYFFKITATPDQYQADGKYELDPDVIIVPDL